MELRSIASVEKAGSQTTLVVEVKKTGLRSFVGERGTEKIGLWAPISILWVVAFILLRLGSVLVVYSSLFFSFMLSD